MSSSEATKGRYAPSPTGALHLGNLRTALIAWLCARSTGSGFVLRIEDLDAGRVRPEHLERQLRDLRALGIDWDGDPVRQSSRIPLYAAALHQLKAQDRVYACFCSRREIREAASAPHNDGEQVLYPGTCRVLSSHEAASRMAAGEPHAMRLRAEHAQVDITDQRHGPHSAIVDDLVLVRRDGAFAYNLAVVVDDAEQGIEEVVRGDDLLASTPDQALLCDLLGLPRPSWFHVPLVLGVDGERLSKRHGAVTLSDLAAEGIGATQVRSRLARSLGLAEAEEEPSPGVLVARFDRDALPTEPWILGAG